MIGYKGTDNFKYINLTYEVGKTYIFEDKNDLCNVSFCKNIMDVHEYYDLNDKNTVILKIEVPDDAIIIDDGDKLVTNKFRILKVLSKREIEELSDGKIKYDDKGNLVYIEDSSGFWERYVYDKNNNLVYYEDLSGYWYKKEYDDKGNLMYYENSSGFWERYEYDNENNLIYYENSNGYCKRK